MSSFTVTQTGRSTGFGPTTTPGGRTEPAEVNDEWAAFSAALDEAKDCDEKTSLASPASAALLKAFLASGYECNFPQGKQVDPKTEEVTVPGVVVLSNMNEDAAEEKVNREVYVLRRMKLPKEPVTKPADKPSEDGHAEWAALPKVFNPDKFDAMKRHYGIWPKNGNDDDEESA